MFGSPFVLSDEELDENTFVIIATRYQLLDHRYLNVIALMRHPFDRIYSPLVGLVHLPPERLWTDADVFLRQMQEGTLARSDALGDA